MDNLEIIGLPVLISERFRIVLSQCLCSSCGISQNGAVSVLISGDTISIFPEGASVLQAEQKQVTLGRFNLPASWVRENGVVVGNYVFLLAAENCLQVRIRPWTLQQCIQDRIRGISVKIRERNFVYVPISLWLNYGIDPRHGIVIREEHDRQSSFQKYQMCVLGSKEKLRVSNCRISVSPSWRRQNNLAVGDQLWLFGTKLGLSVSSKPIFDSFFNLSR